MEKILVGVEEARALLSIGRSQLFELLSAGKIRSVKVGRRRLIPAAALREFVEEVGGGDAA